MGNRGKQSHMDGLLALVLFGVFAACVLSVLLLGADAYQRLTERDRDVYGWRTAAQYLATRIHQADSAGDVRVEDFGGCDALVLRERADGAAYVTRVYWYDGYIRELFTQEDAQMTPQDGEKILEAGGLSLEPGSGGTILAELTDEAGRTLELVFCLRSGEGAAA